MQHVQHGLCAHAGIEHFAVTVSQLPIAALGQKLAYLEVFQLVNLAHYVIFEFCLIMVEAKVYVAYLRLDFLTPFVRDFFRPFTVLRSASKLKLKPFEFRLSLCIQALDALIQCLLLLVNV